MNNQDGTRKRLTRRELLRKGACAGIATGLAALGGIDALAVAVAREVNGRPRVLGGSCAGPGYPYGEPFYGCQSQAVYWWQCEINPYNCSDDATFDCHSIMPDGGSVVCRSSAGGPWFWCTNPLDTPDTAYRCYDGGKDVYFKCNVSSGGNFVCGDQTYDPIATTWEFYCNTAAGHNNFMCDDEGINPGQRFLCNYGSLPHNRVGDYMCNSKNSTADYRC